MRGQGLPLTPSAYTCILTSFGVGDEWERALAGTYARALNVCL